MAARMKRHGDARIFTSRVTLEQGSQCSWSGSSDQSRCAAVDLFWPRRLRFQADSIKVSRENIQRLFDFAELKAVAKLFEMSPQHRQRRRTL